jgi:UDP-GlcNAc:undecaprenyl-phosphate GlcNAc-1-phosphate transferase
MMATAVNSVLCAMLARVDGEAATEAATRLTIFHGYVPVFVVAFLVTLIATPIMRKLAVMNGVVDRPNEARKVHRMPIAYLGGVAVYLGLMAGILYSFFGTQVSGLMDFHAVGNPAHLTEDGHPLPVPVSIMLGLTIIMLVGMIDDVVGISPRVKIGGQLIGAAALAVNEVGVRLAGGVVLPLARWANVAITTLEPSPGIKIDTVLLHIPLPFPIAGYPAIPIDMVYWAGTGIIAIAVLGLCNASNLIDGLDGLLTGTTAIAATGLLVVALGLALAEDGPRDGQRIVLCMALLGACLGFLPHNFNPAVIFLGDAGSLLLGFTTCVIIITLGDTGKTYLVAAGLIIYAVPIIDTSLAIVRRKMAGKPISSADDQHLHHMLKRALGVKGAVLCLYATGAVFAVIGVALSLSRARSVYVVAIIVAAYIAVTAIKVARIRHIEDEAKAFDAKKAGSAGAGSSDGAGADSVAAEKSAATTATTAA